MLVVVSDTHGRQGTRLEGRTHEAVAAADLVIHAGDFTSEAALEAFADIADTVRAVHGNADDETVQGRLPGARTVEYGGARVAVTHTRRGGDTGLAMFGRDRDADVVVHGHSHQPRVVDAGDITLLNPGSHADPWGNRQAHAELEREGDGLAGRLVTVEGEVFERFSVP